jgi:hypothetical protein
MKKALKKLTLAKETLRSLDVSQVAGVVGGATSKKYSDCGSCGIACTVNCASQNYSDCGSCGIACTVIDCTV